MLKNITRTLYTYSFLYLSEQAVFTLFLFFKTDFVVNYSTPN